MIIGLLIFVPACLLGLYALYHQAVNSPIYPNEEGYPVTAKIIPFPAKGSASQFHFHCQDSSGLKLSVRADSNPSRGGNA